MRLETRFQNIVRRFVKKLLQEHKVVRGKPEDLVNSMHNGVINVLLTSPRKDKTAPRAEEVAVELIRSGVPKDSIRARFLYIEVQLENGTYFLYRTGRPKGTVQVDWNGNRCVVQTTLSPKELAETLQGLDGLLPQLEACGEELLVRMRAELKAEEIQRTAVRNQLEAALPPMGVACTFDVKDDKVHLQLTRAFQGNVDLPLTELAAFLSDPERILASLQPAEEGFVEDSERHYFFPGPHFRFPTP